MTTDKKSLFDVKDVHAEDDGKTSTYAVDLSFLGIDFTLQKRVSGEGRGIILGVVSAVTESAKAFATATHGGTKR